LPPSSTFLNPHLLHPLPIDSAYRRSCPHSNDIPSLGTQAVAPSDTTLSPTRAAYSRSTFLTRPIITNLPSITPPHSFHLLGLGLSPQISPSNFSSSLNYTAFNRNTQLSDTYFCSSQRNVTKDNLSIYLEAILASHHPLQTKTSVRRCIYKTHFCSIKISGSCIRKTSSSRTQLTRVTVLIAYNGSSRSSTSWPWWPQATHCSSS